MAIVKNLSFTTLGAAFVVLGLGGAAQAITLTFNELPRQSVEQLSFQGVTFDFKVGGVDSPDAYYNANGPGNLTFVQDPSLEGDSTGILTLNFAAPTPLLNFGVARNTSASLEPGFTVELFDPTLTSMGITAVNTSFSEGFSESQFTYTGALVSQAIIDFTEVLPSRSGAANRFVLDNLTYESVPELSTTFGSVMLLGFGALMTRQPSRKRKRI
jgi:hypothetical protein